ncbi:MAG: acyl-CoA thioesterase [Candidatus Limnocylindria bacterium]
MITRIAAMVSLPPEERKSRSHYTVRWPVRQYELDRFGHVNKAVYFNWIEQAATDHAEAIGFGLQWAQAQDRAWVVREHRITYRRPLVYGNAVLVTTIPERLSGARGWRRTEVHRESDGVLAAEAVTEWTWVRTSDGRPARLPAELLRYLGLS